VRVRVRVRVRVGVGLGLGHRGRPHGLVRRGEEQGRRVLVREAEVCRQDVPLDLVRVRARARARARARFRVRVGVHADPEA